MPRGQLTEPRKAYAVRDLAALGTKPTEISTLTNIPVSTIKEIILGHNGWAERLKDSSFAKYRSVRKRQLQAASLELSSRLLDHAGLNLNTTSPYQAVGMYGILRDKERLDAGEATANVEVHAKHEIVGSEIALASLMQSMGLDAAKVMGYVPTVVIPNDDEVDVEVEVNAESNIDGHGDDGHDNKGHGEEDSTSNTSDA